MTIRRIHEIKKYIGLSTDVKPVDAIIGSEFFEYNTKDTYVVYEKILGVAQWTLKR